MAIPNRVATRCAHIVFAFVLLIGIVVLLHQAYLSSPTPSSSSESTTTKSALETKTTPKGTDTSQKVEVTKALSPSFTERVLGQGGLWILRGLLVLLTSFLAGGLVQRVLLGNFAFKASEIELPALPETPALPPIPFPAVAAFVEESANSSSVMSMLEAIRGSGLTDYAVIDLGSGQSWLTTRLFIFAALMRRMRALKTLVFVESREGLEKVFVGFMSPNVVRWRLARAYPYFEQAFAAAYFQSLPTLQILSDLGAVDSMTAGYLVQYFLSQPSIQYNPNQPGANVAAPTDLERSWVRFKSGTWEHASWVNRALLDQLLDLSPYRQAVVSLANATENERSTGVLACEGAFVALLDERGRFQAVLDRDGALQQLSLTFISLTGAREPSAPQSPVVALASGALLPRRRTEQANPVGPQTPRRPTA